MEDRYVYDRGKYAPIEGLDTLRNAIEDRRQYDYSRKMFEDGVLTFIPDKPKTSVAKLVEQYPRAAAYLEAELFADTASWKKAAIGKEAMQRILDGEDYTMVLDEMKSAWDAWKLAQEG